MLQTAIPKADTGLLRGALFCGRYNKVGFPYRLEKSLERPHVEYLKIIYFVTG